MTGFDPSGPPSARPKIDLPFRELQTSGVDVNNKQRFLQALAGNTGKASLKVICEKTGMKDATAYTVASELKKLGKIDTVRVPGHGLQYRLIRHSEDAPDSNVSRMVNFIERSGGSAKPREIASGLNWDLKKVQQQASALKASGRLRIDKSKQRGTVYVLLNPSGKEAGKKDAAEPAPAASGSLAPSLSLALDRLASRGSGPVLVIEQLEVKLQVLDRLARIVDPEIADVLGRIAGDLKAASST